LVREFQGCGLPEAGGGTMLGPTVFDVADLYEESGQSCIWTVKYSFVYGYSQFQGHDSKVKVKKVTAAKRRQHAGLCSPRTRFNCMIETYII